MRVSVEIVSSDGMSEHEFVFWFDERDRTFKLDLYYYKEKETRRHGFKVFKMWSRLDKRRDNTPKPEVTDFIRQKAKEVFCHSLKFEDK